MIIMNIEKVEGIVLSEVNYGENSKIINIITKEKGLIGVMAKGCKSMKSPLRSVTSKLTYGYFFIYYKEGKLSTLKEVNVIDSFKNLKKDISSISYAAYILELSEGVIKQSKNVKIFDLLASSLKKIDEGFDPLVIMNILEIKYLDFLGVMPILDGCVICGKQKGIVTLSSYRGGYVCTDCHTNEKIVSDKTIKLIRMFLYVDIAKITKLDISLKSKTEINMFLDDYYSRYTGLYLKSKKFIQSLQKLNGN